MLNLIPTCNPLFQHTKLISYSSPIWYNATDERQTKTSKTTNYNLGANSTSQVTNSLNITHNKIDKSNHEAWLLVSCIYRPNIYI